MSSYHELLLVVIVQHYVYAIVCCVIPVSSAQSLLHNVTDLHVCAYNVQYTCMCNLKRKQKFRQKKRNRKQDFPISQMSCDQLFVEESSQVSSLIILVHCDCTFTRYSTQIHRYIKLPSVKVNMCILHHQSGFFRLTSKMPCCPGSRTGVRIYFPHIISYNK